MHVYIVTTAHSRLKRQWMREEKHSRVAQVQWVLWDKKIIFILNFPVFIVSMHIQISSPVTHHRWK